MQTEKDRRNSSEYRGAVLGKHGYLYSSPSISVDQMLSLLIIHPMGAVTGAAWSFGNWFSHRSSVTTQEPRLVQGWGSHISELPSGNSGDLLCPSHPSPCPTPLDFLYYWELWTWLVWIWTPQAERAEEPGGWHPFGLSHVLPCAHSTAIPYCHDKCLLDVLFNYLLQVDRLSNF